MAEPSGSSPHPAPLPRLSLNLADQVLINALAAILLPVVQDAARERMAIEVLGEVLPGASADHPQLAPLVVAARGFFDGPVLDVPREAGAKLRAAGPLADFFMARAGAALEAFRAAKTGGQDG